MKKPTHNKQKKELPVRARTVIDTLLALKDQHRADIYQRFFKTGKGEYGEGDIFLGITVPQTRTVAKKFIDLSFSEIQTMLTSKYHEVRLCALHIMVYRMKSLLRKPDRTNKESAKALYDLYLAHTAHINNWDLVDTSARDIVGGYLYTHEIARAKKVLTLLAKSNLLWERRMAMIATFYGINIGSFELTVHCATLLVRDSHDLMHKAVGWMLREMGKKNMEGDRFLRSFLDAHATTMPRTALRYATERMTAEQRRWYMRK